MPDAVENAKAKAARPLTLEQAQRRDEVDARNRAIQLAGIEGRLKAPASGVFGRPPKAKA